MDSRSVLMTVALCAAASSQGAQIDAVTPQRLAADKGCLLCHGDKPVKADGNTVLANAPSWLEIAGKYRGRADAEEHLVGIVLGGSVPDQRHWRGQAAFSSMWPNAAGVTREEARTLVRWILRSEPRAAAPAAPSRD